MLLAIDIGNSHVSVGLFDVECLARDWRMTTDAERTADEYGALLAAMMREAGFAPDVVDAAIVATVVPSLARVFDEMVSRTFRCEPEFVTSRSDTGVVLDVERPEEVGADRIVNAVAAMQLYETPAVVVDFGTATTFDVVLRGGRYVGGAILPGIQISMTALFERAAQLSKVELRKPPMAIGRNTITCIQSGFYYGFLGQMEKILETITRELGEKPFVIATGGLAGLFAGDSKMVDVVDPTLTLKGLQRIHARTRR